MLFLTLKWRQNAKKFWSFCRNQTIEFFRGLYCKTVAKAFACGSWFYYSSKHVDVTSVVVKRVGHWEKNMARSKTVPWYLHMLCFPLRSSLNVLVLQVEVFNILFVTDNKKHSVYCQDCARKTSANLSGFIVLNQVRVDCTFFLLTGRHVKLAQNARL